MKPCKRMIALLLCAALLLSIVGCARVSKPADSAADSETTAPGILQTDQQESSGTETGNSATEPEWEPPILVDDFVVSEAPLPVDNTDRDSLEQIVDLVSGGSISAEDTKDMDDEALTDIIEDLLQSTAPGNPTGPESTAVPENPGASQAPSGTGETQPEAGDSDTQEGIAEDGSLELPFDQIYPEVVEEELVEYDDETLLLKISNSYGAVISDGMAAAGVAKLESIVPLESATWHEASLIAGTDITAAVEALRQLKEIMLVDYNYQVQTSAMAEYQELPEGWGSNTQSGEQWYLHYCGIPSGYGELTTPGGSSSVIVAVIDTGVDYDHEDLAGNIWVNSDEIPDNGIDDDGNGYKDDYYGVNIVAGSGSGDDDNGHGTHVAGIIAAENNNLGTVGIAYNVKIMPIKAAMASGYLNQSDIAKAILYAYENGAEVINMSFGGTACSIAVQDALSVAYNRCVLVASAGNDGLPNEKHNQALPSYPAALTYVLGVMSVNQSGVESGFSNWDIELYSPHEYELYAPGEGILSTIPGNRYASWSGTSMAAPVVSAMAALLRSEYADRNTYPTKFIYGQLTATTEDSALCCDPNFHGSHNIPGIANLYAALTRLPEPDVGLHDYALFDTAGMELDTAGVNSGEGVIDAGETIALGMTLINRWGMSSDTLVTIDTLTSGGMPDPYITIHNPTVNYGSVGTYSTGNCGAVYTDEMLTGWENPFYITIAEDCPNDYTFRLNVTISCGNALNEEDTGTYTNTDTITLSVRNGMVLPQIIEEDMVLTRNNLYIIANSTVIQAGVTVTVEPGTHIQFWSNDPEDPYADNYIAELKVEGSLLVQGTAEDPVYIYPSDLMSNYPVKIYRAFTTGYISLLHADIINFVSNSSYGFIDYADSCIFRQNYVKMNYRNVQNGVVETNSLQNGNMPVFLDARDCVFYKMSLVFGQLSMMGDFRRCAFINCGMKYTNSYNTGSSIYNDKTRFSHYKDCIFLGNHLTSEGEIYPSSFLVPLMDDSPRIAASYYTPSTGSTHIGLLNTHRNRLTEELLEAMGAQYSILETEQEFLDLQQALDDNYYYSAVYLKICYDHIDQRYEWPDGTPLGDFLGIDFSSERNDYTALYVSDTSTDLSNYSYNTLLEVPGEIYVTDIHLPDYEILLDQLMTYQLQVSCEPVDMPAENLIFESSNEAAVTVDETGLITPVAPGTADVYIYSADRAVFNYISITVKDYVALEALSLPAETLMLPIGSTINAGCTTVPANTTRKDVRYTSSDPAVASVDELGNITALSSGEAVITVVSQELDAEGLPITASMTVTVYNQATSVDIENIAFRAPLSQGTVELPEVILSEGAEAQLSWYSGDPAVADFVDGVLTLKQPGTTSLVVTDARSGLSDSIILVVTEAEEISPFVKLRQHLGLRENGELWNLLRDATTRVLQSDIADFDVFYGSKALFCRTDGTCGIMDYSGSVVEEIEFTQRVVDVESGEDTLFLITESGTVYARGANNYGQLGIGSTLSSVEEFSLVNLENVTMVAATKRYTYFLTGSGQLYQAGGNSDKFLTPQLLQENVSCVYSFDYDRDEYWYVQDGIAYGGSALPEGAVVTGYKSYILNGVPYSSTGYSNAIEQMQGITNAQVVNFFENATLTSCEDGLLYGAGNIMYSGYFGTTSGQVELESPVLIPLETTFETELTLDGTNLNEESVLDGSTLILDFNKELEIANCLLYADGNQTPVSYTISHDRFLIFRTTGFESGVTYRLVIPADNIQGIHLTRAAADIEITFTCVNGEIVVSGSSTAEPVVNEAITDESIVRDYWTEDDTTAFFNKLTEIIGQEHKNHVFANNVILNHVSTDTDTSHWLRPVAPTASTYTEAILGGNYWGTTNETAVQLQMVDYTDFTTYARLLYAPYLTEAPENTFPFITGVTILNKAGEEVTTVSNEEITVRVTFNRDMDVTVPLIVTFGSALPYADYTIDGSYVDERTWEGKYTLSTLIENGNQYFSFSGGRSAEDNLGFYTDSARFSFVLDTTAAQALIMQGSATDTGIQLTWTQDDFDTLMGYNVYRATSEDGYYQRLNSTVIPAETREFFDDTVEPGVLYYYNFTVVKTDLTESIPSGKIAIMSKDTMAPNLYHTPVYSAFTGSNLVISATVTDNLAVSTVRVFYRTTGAAEWKVALMNKLNDKYSAIIPADQITTEGLEYYLDATDGINITQKGSADAPYQITVQEAVSSSSLGDVNGDGRISNLDALMLLQAINDLLNLDSEQFARADLNGDGSLAAAEALRILQYVSGTVGDLIMP